MPAVNFKIEWPDGEVHNYYSPSTVIRDYLNEGSTYSISLFEKQVFSALEKASQRVQKKYGYACSAAADEMYKIQKKMNELENDTKSNVVTVISLI